MRQDPYVEELLALHTYLERWLKGETPRGDGRPSRLERALASDFVMVQPDGSRAGKAQVVEAFAAAHGEKPPGYALEIAPVQARCLSGSLCLVTYREAHRGEAGRERISTALLRARGRAGIEWLFLQETPTPRGPG